MGVHRGEKEAGPSIFGTDGVRDKAGAGYLTPDSVARIAGAAHRVLAERHRYPEDFPAGRGRTVVVARDTRESGLEISRTLSRSFTRCGYSVLDLGVLPTPGAAFIASVWPEAVLGVVISASHNPADYNGIKFVAPTGAKISPEFEKAVSDAYWREQAPAAPGPGGESRDASSPAFEEYARYLVSLCRRPDRLAGRKVVLDAAHGATYRVAPEVFRRLGMDVIMLGDRPDGTNINQGSGALHPQLLAAAVREAKAAMGFSFDGDGDRMIPVTAAGTILDGDHVLCLSGKSYHRAGRLPKRSVVATVMSNLGLELALRADGLKLLRTDVGDRHVYLAMVEGSHPVGGEQSGHVIFLEDARTGDGILAALRLLDVIESDDLDLEGEAAVMKRYPQLLKNVKVSKKVPLESLPPVNAAVKAAEERLGGEGRIVLRYSGTEPLARVMLEGPDWPTVESLTDRICQAIRESLPEPK